MKTLTKFSGVVFGLLISGSSLFAKSAGNTTANFLKVGVGGRGAAMGDAQTAAVEDVTGLYWNPAGLGGARTKEIGDAQQSRLRGHARRALLCSAHRVSLGVWGFGGNFLRVSGVDGYDAGIRPPGMWGRRILC